MKQLQLLLSQRIWFMPSVRQVAEIAGVSIATVSRVLNGQPSVNPTLRDKVLHAADQCQYVPSVGRRTADRLALLYTTSHFTVGSPYDSACIDGLVSVMRQTPYDLTVLDMQRDRNDGESLKSFFARKGIRGAIVRSAIEQRDTLREMAVEEDVPLIVLGDHFDHPTLRFCYADSREASREAVEHLVSLGHRDIAFASCDVDDGDHIDRYTAYREVLEEAGLYQEDLVYRVPPYRMDGAPLVRRVLGKRKRPSAMFIADPLVAVGVLNEAHRLGVDVPGELSLVAVDDSDTRNMVHPCLSSVCQDSTRLGVQAMEALVDLIDTGVATALEPRQEAWFEIHDTTAPAPETVERFLPNGRSVR